MKIYRPILCYLKLENWKPTFATELKAALLLLLVLENELFCKKEIDNITMSKKNKEGQMGFTQDALKWLIWSTLPSIFKPHGTGRCHLN